MQQKLLIHLHPDFESPLKSVFEKWNFVQDVIKFIGLRPGRSTEKKLLASGAISDSEASSLADDLRRDVGCTPSDGILIFTEKRLYDDTYYQLFVGGCTADDDPPSVSVLSLHYLRQMYLDSQSESPLLFRAIISNILFSIGAEIGLNDHKKSKSCIMDFCDDMQEIEKGLHRGPKFCQFHVRQLESSENGHLLELARSAREFDGMDAIDSEVSELIVVRGKRYEQQPDGFDFDVALSYAGKDQRYADSLARALKEEDITVFYAKFGRANLWGKNLHTYLSELYRLRARYCVVLLSRHYAESQWTKHELEAALAREFQQEQEYVLPIRLDKTKVDGILPTRAYVDWNEESVESLVLLVQQKLAITAEQDDAVDRPVAGN